MAVSVNDLRRVNFASRPLEEQLRIVALGRPLPLNVLSQASKNCRTLLISLAFEQVQWLIYCEEWREFFCWPCLLFTPQFRLSLVKTQKYADLKSILAETNRHEITEGHLACSLKLQIFISENFQPSVSTQDKVGYNNVVKKNREMLKCIFDAICSVVVQKQFESDGKYSFNMISVKNCKNYLQLLKDYHPRKSDIVDGAVDLLNSNPPIVNQLVDAMTRSVKMSIKNDTKKSTYVSIILSQHGRMKSQMSTILRYINRGKVCERFIGFTNLVGINSMLAQYILRPIEEYGIADRFLALSLDGEISYGQSLSQVIGSISTSYRFSYFVPWHSHGFGYALLQTLSINSECGFFLKMISGMQDFFRNEKHFRSFEVLLRQRIPDYSESPKVKWNLHSNFVVYVAKYRRYFMEFFKNIISNSRCQKNGIVAQAVAFRSFLQEFLNVFLLMLFHEIFSVDFDETFNFHLDPYAFSPVRIHRFKQKVDEIDLARIRRALEAEAEREKSLKVDLFSKVEKYEALFRTLMRHLSFEIETRCVHLSSRLGFCDLFDVLRDCPGDGDFKFNEHFDGLQKQMMAEHGEFFHVSELMAEMNAIKSNPDLRSKTVHQLLEHFARYNLRGLFPQSYKLVEFILTLPYLPASREREGAASKLEDIKKFSYYPEGIGIPCGEVSFLSIERELLQSLRQSPSFYDDALARFNEVNKTIPVVQI